MLLRFICISWCYCFGVILCRLVLCVMLVVLIRILMLLWVFLMFLISVW